MSFEAKKAVQDRKKALDEKLDNDPALTCLPFVSIQAISLINDPKTTIREMGDLAATDAILTSKLLEEVNNPKYELKYTVEDVHQAIHFLGFDKVKDLVFKVATEKLRTNSILKNLFKENLRIANFAKQACNELDNFKVSDQAYVAGLLQGVGRLYLLENYSTEYMHMFNYKHDQLMEKEAETFGYTYPEISAKLIKAWKLSPGSITAVENCYILPTEESSQLEIALYYAVGMAEFDKKSGLSPKYIGLANKNKEAIAQLNLKTLGLKKVFSHGYSLYDELTIKFNF